MGENSAIEWTTHTFNPWVGCTKISVGPQGACEHCYAEGWAKRTGNADLWAGSRRRTTPANWRQPLKWNAAAERAGIRPRVFCASLADVFDNDVPDEWRIALWELIAATPHLDWLLLTKRIGNAARMLPVMDSTRPGYRPWNQRWPWPNVWLGATIATQEEADRDIPKLIALPAVVRFLSCEPLLGPIDLSRLIRWGNGNLTMVKWVIVGGESGPRARPFVLGWGKEIVRQCREAGAACFVKQVGAMPVNREGERCPHVRDSKGKVMAEWPEELRVREFPLAGTGEL